MSCKHGEKRVTSRKQATLAQLLGGPIACPHTHKSGEDGAFLNYFSMNNQSAIYKQSRGFLRGIDVRKVQEISKSDFLLDQWQTISDYPLPMQSYSFFFNVNFSQMTVAYVYIFFIGKINPKK